MSTISEIMYTHYCDLCGYCSSPRFSEELPHNWEQTEVNGKTIDLCTSHRFGLSQEEINWLHESIR